MIGGTLIALPAKDEEARIGNTISSVSQYGDVYVFDNNSIDKTCAISEALGVKVINSPLNGYEPVVYHIANYFLESKYEILVILDADGEVGLPELPVGLSMLSNYDGVIGNRDLKKRFVERLICKLFFRKTCIMDVFCGFKILTRRAIAAKLVEGTFATALVDKTANFTNISTVVNLRKGSRLGNELLVSIRLLIGGLRGYFS
jgi:glycosyltransferase involved in cell wall biosynthesis